MRHRIWTPFVTLLAFIRQTLKNGSCSDAVKAAQAELLDDGQKACSANTSAYCQARQKLPENLLLDLVHYTGERLDTASQQHWSWRGRAVRLGNDIDLINRKDRDEIIRMFNKDVLPVLGDLFVEDVRKGHIGLVVDNLKMRGVNHLARNLLKLMRQMFRFAVDKDVIEFDPTASLSIAKTTTKPTERDRVLTELEIRALARQLPDAHLIPSTECAVWIALSTMCRIGELSKATFSDLDFEVNTWTIPAANSKNSKAHTVYLSDFALEQFKRLKAVAQSDTWIFPNRDNSSHVCEKSITKQISGRQTENILSNRSQHNQALVLTGDKWTPHDLRRTGGNANGRFRYSAGCNREMLESYRRKQNQTHLPAAENGTGASASMAGIRRTVKAVS